MAEIRTSRRPRSAIQALRDQIRFEDEVQAARGLRVVQGAPSQPLNEEERHLEQQLEEIRGTVVPVGDTEAPT